MNEYGTTGPSTEVRRLFSRRLAVLASAALAVTAGVAVVTVPASADPATPTSSSAPTPSDLATGDTPYAPTAVAPTGTQADTVTAPIRCRAGSSGVITFQANDAARIGALNVTGDTVCRTDVTDLAAITPTAPDPANAMARYAWNPTDDTVWEGTQQDAGGCLVVTGSNGPGTPVAAAFSQGTLTGNYSIDAAAPDRFVEFYGVGCRLYLPAA